MIAALANPHMKIFVSFVSRHKKLKVKLSPVVASIASYSNVRFNFLDLVEFSEGTPMEEFIQNGQLLKSSFVVSHTSDVLRLLVLWKYGGTYLDTDMIVRKKLDSVPANFACDDIANTVNGAILNFSHSENGQALAEKFMLELVHNFNGTVWGSNGPLLLTRVLKKLCGTSRVTEMIAKQSCDGFHVLPKALCYPITGVSWAKFFNETLAERAMKTVDDAIVVHFWNNLSKKTQLPVNSTAAYAQLARIYCPKVFESCGDYF